MGSDATVVTVKKPKTGAKKSKGHKGKRQSHNKDTRKYEKQRIRTTANKMKNIEKEKAKGNPNAGVSFTQSDYR